MTPLRHTFRKAERLCSKKHIESLFFGKRSGETDYAGGSRSLSAYPLRAVYREVAGEQQRASIQLLISVSKRRFKHAVDRNRVKRLIREAYRLNKSILIDSLQGRNIDLAFIWISDELSDFATIESKVKNLLQRIGENERMRE